MANAILAPSFRWEDAKSEQRLTLGQAAPAEGDAFLYIDDMGIMEHEIRVGRLHHLEEGKFYPVCLGGKRAGPPEDIGGPPGYEEFLSDRQSQPPRA